MTCFQILCLSDMIESIHAYSILKGNTKKIVSTEKKLHTSNGSEKVGLPYKPFELKLIIVPIQFKLNFMKLVEKLCAY